MPTTSDPTPPSHDELVDIIEQAIFETDTGLTAALLAAERILAATPPSPVTSPDGLRTALERLINAAEPSMECYYGGMESGCDHRPIVTAAIEQARTALENGEH